MGAEKTKTEANKQQPDWLHECRAKELGLGGTGFRWDAVELPPCSALIKPEGAGGSPIGSTFVCALSGKKESGKKRYRVHWSHVGTFLLSSCALLSLLSILGWASGTFDKPARLSFGSAHSLAWGLGTGESWAVIHCLI